MPHDGDKVYPIPTQMTRILYVKRVDDGWLVWLHGSPHKQHHTYLYLHDTGSADRVTESPDGVIDHITWRVEDGR